ncbi:MAG: hypothetical protein EAX96_07215 [Candidatus Lokiarchaeota archaeon]|nr:hypothetical protein [Candidatus Lokiarchaeota archaeon]
MERVRWINHKGKNIIVADYSNLRSNKPEDKAIVFRVIDEFKKELNKLKGKKALTLTDVTNSYANSETMDALKSLAKYCKEKDLIEKECAVGITGVKKFLLQVVNLFGGSDVKPFNDMEPAMEYLVSEK